MLRHNLLLIYRNFRRFKSTFFINLTGLATGLACALLIFLWVNDELKMDKFHEKDSQLFQVLTNHHTGEGIDTWRSGPVPLAPALAEEMPEVEYAVNSSGVEDNFTISYGEGHNSASGQFADENYFEIFSYELLQGDKNQVLRDKNSMVISETMAINLFNTTDNVVGKTIEVKHPDLKKQFTISGVFKDIPANSSDQFDFIISFEVYIDMLGEDAHWGNNQAHTYLVLKEETDIEEFGHKIADFTKTKSKGSIVTLSLQRYSDQYLFNRFENGSVAGGRIEYVKLFSIIALFILLIACINFMNLSTAKASRRIKEVGIKKAVGAGRKTLVFQYLIESLTISFLSVLIALLLVLLLLPQFNVITGKQLTLDFNAELISSVILATVFTGLIAGSYPAFYLSGFNPTSVLRGKFNSALGELWARKGLVVFQFALSVILIVSVAVVYKQLELIQYKNLGYERENIIYFPIEGKAADHLESFLSEIKQIPGIVNASSMWGSINGKTGISQGYFNWEGKDPDAVIPFSSLGINYDMLEVLGIEMAAGRTFSRDFNTDTTKIIFNQAAIEVMGLQDPVGKTFNLWGNEMEIIGVTQNFHFRSLHEDVKPFFFRLSPFDANQKVLVKMRAGTEKTTLASLQKFYTEYNPAYTLDYRFLDDEYQAQYAAEQRVSTLSKYFAGIAILISCLGLFGLAAFTAERRIKEIGVRKVLGAGEWKIIKLLSGDFALLVLASIAIALPVSYYITKSWLESFAFKIDLEWWFFVGAGVLTLVIALSTVSFHSIKAALTDPVESLRSE